MTATLRPKSTLSCSSPATNGSGQCSEPSSGAASATTRASRYMALHWVSTLGLDRRAKTRHVTDWHALASGCTRITIPISGTTTPPSPDRPGPTTHAWHQRLRIPDWETGELTALSGAAAFRDSSRAFGRKFRRADRADPLRLRVHAGY